MKKGVLFLALSVLMLMISCGDDQPTKVSNYVFDKRNIENDTNWVEVKDIDTVDISCLTGNDIYLGKIFESEIDFKNFYDTSFCGRKYGYKSTQVNFNTNFMILYGMNSNDVNWYRKIYYNQASNEYLHLLKIERTSDHANMTWFLESVQLPRRTAKTKVTFDTINTNIWD